VLIRLFFYKFYSYISCLHGWSPFKFLLNVFAEKNGVSKNSNLFKILRNQYIILEYLNIMVLCFMCIFLLGCSFINLGIVTKILLLSYF
jgi:hypothetical protein